MIYDLKQCFFFLNTYTSISVILINNIIMVVNVSLFVMFLLKEIMVGSLAQYGKSVGWSAGCGSGRMLLDQSAGARRKNIHRPGRICTVAGSLLTVL